MLYNYDFSKTIRTALVLAIHVSDKIGLYPCELAAPVFSDLRHPIVALYANVEARSPDIRR